MAEFAAQNQRKYRSQNWDKTGSKPDQNNTKNAPGGGRELPFDMIGALDLIIQEEKYHVKS